MPTLLINIGCLEQNVTICCDLEEEICDVILMHKKEVGNLARMLLFTPS